jgi:hypothetical protein
MLDGVDIIFIVPPVFLVLLAFTIGAWRLSTRGIKAAIMTFVRVLVFGGFALFILFFVWVGIYYGGGGH